MTVEENKAILRRVDEELFAKGNLAVADELIARDCVDHDPLPNQAPGGEGIKESARVIHAAFPDMQISFDVVFAEGDHTVARWTARATHRGELMGIPATGKPITITGIDVVRIAEGQIVEWWHNEDIMGMMQQIGAVPAPGSQG